MNQRFKKGLSRVLEFLLHKYPLVNALTFLMLLAERAPSEKHPPINPRLIYANLLGFLACGLMMSSHIKRKETALIFCGQLVYFAYNFYNNPKLHYPEWLRLQMSTRHIGCVGVYLWFAYVVDQKRSRVLGRSAEITLGLYLFSCTYLINNTREIRTAVLAHILGGDWGRYILTVVIAACALSFFSGYFLRDMSICAAVAIATLTFMVDCDFNYSSRKGVHTWNQIRMVGDNLCICAGLVFNFLHLSNRVKTE